MGLHLNLVQVKSFQEFQIQIVARLMDPVNYLWLIFLAHIDVVSKVSPLLTLDTFHYSRILYRLEISSTE